MSNNENFEFEFNEKTPLYKRTTFYLFIIMAIISVVVLAFFLKTTIQNHWDEKELMAALEVRVAESFWAQKKGLHNETVIVPAARITIRNISKRPVSHVSFNGVFQFDESKEDVGSGFQIAFQDKPLQPGTTSPEILIKSDFGYKASSLQAFYKNIDNWKTVSMRLFARVGDTTYVLLGVFPVKQEIQGVKLIYDNSEESQSQENQ